MWQVDLSRFKTKKRNILTKYSKLIEKFLKTGTNVKSKTIHKLERTLLCSAFCWLRSSYPPIQLADTSIVIVYGTNMFLSRASK